MLSKVKVVISYFYCWIERLNSSDRNQTLPIEIDLKVFNPFDLIRAHDRGIVPPGILLGVNRGVFEGYQDNSRLIQPTMSDTSHIKCNFHTLHTFHN
jgi:hypothetical protein